MASTLAPIIIKRVKKGGGGGHHGGAWKVAYADFVTAMMAFFLLLWLLNVTTPEQKKGIADYFTPTIGIKDSKGIGVKGGRKAAKRGISKNDTTAVGLVMGQVQQGPIVGDPNDIKRPDNSTDASAVPNKEAPPVHKEKSGPEDGAKNEDNSQDSEQFKITGDEIRQAVSVDQDIQQFRNNIEVHDTPEGLRLDLVDDDKQPMFVAGGATITEGGKKILDSMANIIVKTPNEIAIIGHTDAAGPIVNPKYTNWELSADRANAARRLLSTTQLEPARVVKVMGLADHDLLVPNEPTSPRNRRVTILLIRGSYFRDPKSEPMAHDLISAPDAKLKVKEAPKPEIVAPAQTGPSIFDQR